MVLKVYTTMPRKSTFLLNATHYPETENKEHRKEGRREEEGRKVINQHEKSPFRKKVPP